MKKKKRMYCHYCNAQVELKMEGDILRDYCPVCEVYFYENPLPVVSTILVRDRQVLLVKRGNEPYRGQWCFPSGFAESGESIAEAALRELEEETGVKGKIVQLQDVDSCSNYYYGDLLARKGYIVLAIDIDHDDIVHDGRYSGRMPLPEKEDFPATGQKQFVLAHSPLRPVGRP